MAAAGAVIPYCFRGGHSSMLLARTGLVGTARAAWRCQVATRPLAACRALSGLPPSEPTYASPKPKEEPKGFLQSVLRAVGYYSQESKDDRLALITFLKCREHAHRPEFRTEFGVPDTFHGTFQLIGLHAWMCHVRLRLENPQRGNHVASELFEHWWHQTMLDMKEAGVHEFLQISANLKELQQGFRGSATSYDDALKADDTLAQLQAALLRNVYFKEEGSEKNAEQLSLYVEQQLVQLLGMTSDEFMSADPAAWAFAKPSVQISSSSSESGSSATPSDGASRAGSG